jgi:hypothetical protein
MTNTEDLEKAAGGLFFNDPLKGEEKGRRREEKKRRREEGMTFTRAAQASRRCSRF